MQEKDKAEQFQTRTLKGHFFCSYVRCHFEAPEVASTQHGRTCWAEARGRGKSSPAALPLRRRPDDVQRITKFEVLNKRNKEVK